MTKVNKTISLDVDLLPYINANPDLNLSAVINGFLRTYFEGHLGGEETLEDIENELEKAKEASVIAQLELEKVKYKKELLESNEKKLDEEKDKLRQEKAISDITCDVCKQVKSVNAKWSFTKESAGVNVCKSCFIADNVSREMMAGIMTFKANHSQKNESY